jgi:hypothetical protein
LLADAHEDARLAIRYQLEAAINTLRDCMADPSAAIRLKAATYVIELASTSEPSTSAIGPEDPTTLKTNAALAQFSFEQKLANP